MTTRQLGTVTWFNPNTGSGQIQELPGQQYCSFSLSDIEQIGDEPIFIGPGRMVSFEVENDRAVKIKVLQT
ncbi:hypothetical protein N7495_004855 [Penicillium taxi]|uniref:uncharacterized protein n=1 Tax=Penicillium taxi TaxID=168475 RepID=UPI002545BDAB|nr:uncharacterized protein N7495_004855 [Penicillium taxi]KAJ5900111.1 hypothetical protein N7495_004855 [Penicillium taxi]